MSNTTIKRWTCGFCGVGNHDRCAGAALNQGKPLVCSCDRHPLVVRCLECGNTNPDELTGWACTNPTDCRDAIASRSAANPLRKELDLVRRLGGEARRRALAVRLERDIRRAVLYSGIDEEIGHDVAADLDRPRKARKARAVRPSEGVCTCGCEGKTRGGRFLPGHDAKLKGRLSRAIVEGDSTAYDRMVELGWERFAIIAVEKRRKALDAARVSA